MLLSPPQIARCEGGRKGGVKGRRAQRKRREETWLHAIAECQESQARSSTVEMSICTDKCRYKVLNWLYAEEIGWHPMARRAYFNRVEEQAILYKLFSSYSLCMYMYRVSQQLYIYIFQVLTPPRKRTLISVAGLNGEGQYGGTVFQLCGSMRRILQGLSVAYTYVRYHIRHGIINAIISSTPCYLDADNTTKVNIHLYT